MYLRDAKHVIGLLVLAGALLLPPFVQAQGPNPPPPPREPGRFPLPLLPGAQPQARTGDQASATPECAPWSKLTFAAYHGSAWDVYTANGSGTGKTQLTDRDSPDTAPKFNRGCTRIAYQSLRGNDYEICVMNADGTGQVCITSNTANDGIPCWSPSGTQIAFESDRDGNDEVYVMNAGGANQTRLTTNPAYDGMPAWSPDGSRIAFVSNRTGQYEVWVMNADGTGQTQVTSSSVQWAQYPCWSPDGTRIAFSNDDNGDGFMDIDVVNADGTGFAFVAGHTNSVDYWYPTWSPDGEWIAYGRTELIYYQGNWYWTRSDIYAKGAPEYEYAQTALVASGRDWRPHWGTLDAQAPTSEMHNPPALTGLLDAISWSGQDSGPAGFRSYDVQYRDGEEGSWIDWLIDTPNTSGNFVGEPGHVYYFRCRAQDRAWNREPYPSTGRYAHTTFYTYRLYGRVLDNRDTPVTSAMVDISPPPLYPTATDATGHYDAYLTSVSTCTIDASKAGYGILFLMPIQDIQVSQLVISYLPPADDQIQNGGFESNSPTFDGWQQRGPIWPVVADIVQHTGDHAARLGLSVSSSSFAAPLNLSENGGSSTSPHLVVGKSGTVHMVWSDSTAGNADILYAHRKVYGNWSDPQNISNTTGPSERPQLAVDENGTAHVVWLDKTPGNYRIYYAHQIGDDTWSNPEDVSGDTSDPNVPQIATDVVGNVHMVWNDDVSGNHEIYYARRSSSGTWHGPQNISNNAGFSYAPQLAVDKNGVVHVVWQDSTPGNRETFYAYRVSSGSWSSPQNISKNATNSAAQRLAVDENRVVHVVWVDRPSNDDIYYACRTSDGTWSTVQNISDNSGLSSSAQLAVEGNGVIHVVWWDDTDQSVGSDIYYARRTSDGTWSSPQNVSNNAEVSAYPQVAVSKAGIVHLIWRDATPGNWDILYAYRASDGSWSSPQNVSNSDGDSQEPQLAVDDNGIVHIGWQDPTPSWGPNDIYYIGPAHADQTGNSSIAQVVTLPLTVSSPTLSFLYRLGGASAADNTWFNVQVDDNISATTLLSTTTNTENWTHSWLDMTPWAGQTITITFTVRNQAGTPNTWVYLDEVTLGSAYPNLWVDKTGDLVLPPGGGTVQYVIDYGNAGSVPAQTVRLTDTLPAGVTFLSASPTPTTTAPLVWDLGDLAAGEGPHTILVTATVDASVPTWTSLPNTATIGAVTPEADRDNNTAVAWTFVGYRGYLPLAMKEW